MNKDCSCEPSCSSRLVSKVRFSDLVSLRAARRTPITVATGSRWARSPILSWRTIPAAITIKVRLPLLFSSLAAFLSKHGLARQSDFARRVHVDHLHQQLLAFGEFITNVAHTVVGYLRNVQQAVGARHDFYKRAKVGDALNGAEVGFVDFGYSGDFFDQPLASFGLLEVRRSNVDPSRVFHVDLAAGLFNQASNHLAAR